MFSKYQWAIRLCIYLAYDFTMPSAELDSCLQWIRKTVKKERMAAAAFPFQPPESHNKGGFCNS